MDPISIISIISGAAAIARECTQVIKLLKEITDKFSISKITCASMMQELDIVCLAWERIESYLHTWGDSGEMDTHFLDRLERQLDFGKMIMAALSEDLSSFDLETFTFIQKTRFVWNESLFQAHQERIRGQAAALTLLVSVMQL